LCRCPIVRIAFPAGLYRGLPISLPAELGSGRQSAQSFDLVAARSLLQQDKYYMRFTISQLLIVQDVSLFCNYLIELLH
jgi:hypothetical protein